MKTVFLGDSLTEGIPGVSYWRFLHNKTKLINRGLGGDTLLGAMNRVNKMLSNPKYDDVDQYIIEIGTNDILLPSLEKHSFIWRLIIKIKGKTLGCVPCRDICIFQEKYEELLQNIIKQDKKIGVIGLPMIENSILSINNIMDEYNAVIERLCEKYNIAYLDIKQLEIETVGNHCGNYFFGKTNLGNIIDTLFTTILPFSMLVSISITVDSTHLNRHMAKKFAKEVEIKFLKYVHFEYN